MISSDCFPSGSAKVNIKLHVNSEGKLVFYSGEKIQGHKNIFHNYLV